MMGESALPATAAADDPAPSLVSFESADPSVRIPDRTTVTATTNFAQSGYSILIVDADNNQDLARCYLGPFGSLDNQCSYQAGRGWESNPDPAPLHLRAYVFKNYVGIVGEGMDLSIGVQRHTFGVSLSAEDESLRVPEQTQVTATVDEPLAGTDYEIVMEYADSNQTLKTCPGEQSCTATVGRSWDDNEDPKPIQLRTFVRKSRGTDIASNTATTYISVQRHTFGISLSAEDESVRIPEDTQVTASVDESLAGTGYEIVMEYASNQTLKTCPGEQSCTATVGRGWDDNADPEPIELRAEVRKSRSLNPASNRATQTVDVETHHFAPEISFPEHPDATTWMAKATSGEPHPYSLAIERHSSSFAASCYSEECTQSVGPGTYRATVVDRSGRSFGHSGWYRLDEDGVTSLSNADGTDLVAVAAMFAGPAAVCDALTANRYPGTHYANATTSDQLIACLAAAAVFGATTVEVLQAVDEAAPGDTVIDFLEDYGETSQDPDQANSPRPLPPPPANSSPSQESDEDQLLEQNPNIEAKLGSHAKAKAAAHEILRRCQQSAGWASQPDTDCLSAPIFFSGDDVREATGHDYAAMFRQPAWRGLNYLPRGDAGRGWYSGKQECASRTSEQDCDEYPFYSTVQGGGSAVPQPSLRPIARTDNRRQGGFYGAFSRRCLKSVPSSPFLVVTAPRNSGIPTMSICN